MMVNIATDGANIVVSDEEILQGDKSKTVE
jgi:hypothetical protein